MQHALDSGWMHSAAGKPNLVALLTSAWEASLGVAQLHRENIIHGGVTPATCFLKAARNQRGFVVKVGAIGSCTQVLLNRKATVEKCACTAQRVECIRRNTHARKSFGSDSPRYMELVHCIGIGKVWT